MNPRIERIRARMRTLLDERAQAQEARSAIYTAAEARAADEATDDDGALTPEEDTQFNELRARITAIDEERTTLAAELEALEDEQRQDDAAAEMRGRYGAGREDTVGGTTSGGTVTVTNEERIYRSGPGGPNFLMDAWAIHTNRADEEVRERLRRNRLQCIDDLPVEQRDIGVAAFGALVTPQYMTELFAKVLRSGRIFLSQVRSLPLPEIGQTITIPRGTTGTAVAVQASEGTAVQETDFDETDLTVNVRTYAGQQDVSRQALERGVGTEAILMEDLVRDYATKLNIGTMFDDGTSGTHLGLTETAGIHAVTYTDASPTVPEFLLKLADAIQRIAGQRYVGPTAVVMHPRRWGWLTGATDTAGRPLVLPGVNMPQNAAGIGTPAAYGAVGQLQGVPVFTDAGIATNQGAGTEDSVIVMFGEDHILWEVGDGTPRELRFEEIQGDTLEVKLVVYGYTAFTAGRYPVGAAEITGTGLIAPTF